MPVSPATLSQSQSGARSTRPGVMAVSAPIGQDQLTMIGSGGGAIGTVSSNVASLSVASASREK